MLSVARSIFGGAVLGSVHTTLAVFVVPVLPAIAYRIITGSDVPNYTKLMSLGRTVITLAANSTALPMCTYPCTDLIFCKSIQVALIGTSIFASACFGTVNSRYSGFFYTYDVFMVREGRCSVGLATLVGSVVAVACATAGYPFVALTCGMLLAHQVACKMIDGVEVKLPYEYP